MKEPIKANSQEALTDYHQAENLRRERETTSVLTVDERLDLIAQEINTRVVITKREVYEIGKLLVEAKELVGHGNYQHWVEEKCDFSYPTAVNMMRVYQCCLGRPELVSNLKPSVLYQIAAPGYDKDLREYLVENLDRLDGDLDNKTAKSINKKVKERGFDPDDPDIKKIVKEQEKKDEDERYKAKVDEAIKDYSTLPQKILDLGTKLKWPKLDGELLLTPSQKKELESIHEEIQKAAMALKPNFDELIEN